jgi:methylated-DNA-protein-cysteine methyltransferase-like protein
VFDKILDKVRQIPRGKVATYGAVAEAAGFPGAARQVVWALRSGGKAVPWQRVLGAGGKIRLPGESGLEQKLRLRVEGVEIAGERVDMKRFEHKFPKPGAAKLKTWKTANSPASSTKRRT